jgi:hypothetical protein
LPGYNFRSKRRGVFHNETRFGEASLVDHSKWSGFRTTFATSNHRLGELHRDGDGDRALGLVPPVHVLRQRRGRLTDASIADR